MRKAIALLLVLVMVFAVSGCGKKEPEEPTVNTEENLTFVVQAAPAESENNVTDEQQSEAEQIEEPAADEEPQEEPESAPTAEEPLSERETGVLAPLPTPLVSIPLNLPEKVRGEIGGGFQFYKVGKDIMTVNSGAYSYFEYVDGLQYHIYRLNNGAWEDSGSNGPRTLCVPYIWENDCSDGFVRTGNSKTICGKLCYEYVNEATNSICFVYEEAGIYFEDSPISGTGPSFHYVAWDESISSFPINPPA